MVKLDNWQTKAERAAIRRIETKARKVRRDRTRRNKALARGALNLLDEHGLRLLALCSSRPFSSSCPPSTHGQDQQDLSSRTCRCRHRCHPRRALEIHVWADTAASTEARGARVGAPSSIKGRGDHRGDDDSDDDDDDNVNDDGKRRSRNGGNDAATRRGVGRPRSESSPLLLPSGGNDGEGEKSTGAAVAAAAAAGEKVPKNRPRSLSDASSSALSRRRTNKSKVKVFDSRVDKCRYGNYDHGDGRERYDPSPNDCVYLCAERFFGRTCPFDAVSTEGSGRGRGRKHRLHRSQSRVVGEGGAVFFPDEGGGVGYDDNDFVRRRCPHGVHHCGKGRLALSDVLLSGRRSRSGKRGGGGGGGGSGSGSGSGSSSISSRRRSDRCIASLSLHPSSLSPPSLRLSCGLIASGCNGDEEADEEDDFNDVDDPEDDNDEDHDDPFDDPIVSLRDARAAADAAAFALRREYADSSNNGGATDDDGWVHDSYSSTCHYSSNSMPFLWHIPIIVLVEDDDADADEFRRGSESYENGRKGNTGEEVITDAAAAAAASPSSSPPSPSPRLAERIVSSLVDAGCAVADMVYLVVNGVLVFDRNQDGVVLSEHDAHALFYGDGGAKRRAAATAKATTTATSSLPPPPSSSPSSVLGREGGSTGTGTTWTRRKIEAAAAAEEEKKYEDDEEVDVDDDKADSKGEEEDGEREKEGGRRRRIKRGRRFRSRTVSNGDDVIVGATSLPGQVLEYVLTFLPDESTAVAPLVCRAWRDEVGRSSPELWRYLMSRRGWPLPFQMPSPSSKTTLTVEGCDEGMEEEAGEALDGSGHATDGATSSSSSSSLWLPPPPTTPMMTTAAAKRYRECFVRHYIAVRDVDAIQEATRRLLTGGAGSGGSKKSSKVAAATMTESGAGRRGRYRRSTALLPFKSMQNAPESVCVGFRVWSANRILAAFSGDCTLRLFETWTGSGSGAAIVCRQTVCVRAFPLHSKKAACRMVAVDLDDDFVSCLINVQWRDDARGGGGRRRGGLGRANHLDTWLTLARRDDVLLSAGGGGVAPNEIRSLEQNSLHSFDLRLAVLDYFLSPADSEAYFQPLYDHLSGDGSMGDLSLVEVRVRTQRVVACGNMRYLFEAEIFVPNSEEDNEVDDDDNSVQIWGVTSARKIFLFSACNERVIWACKAEGFDSTTAAAYTSSSLVGLKSVGSKADADAVVAFASTASSVVQVIQLEVSNGIHLHRLAQVHHNAWMAHDPSPLDAGQTLGMDAEHEGRIWTCTRSAAVVTRSDVVVAESFVGTGDLAYSFKAVLSFHPFSRKSQTETNQICLQQGCVVYDLLNLRDDYVVAFCKDYSTQWEMTTAGTWRRTSADCEMLSAVLVHVPTRRELHRACLGYYVANDCPHETAYPLSVAADGDFVAVCASGLGAALICASGEAFSLGTASDANRAGETHRRRDGTKKGKKKKSHKQVSRGGKKDGFARGMTMRG